MRSACSPCALLRSLLAVAFAAVLALPSAALAQAQPSLAELAREEAARRKTVKDTKKVITAKDLPESARRPATAAAQADGSGATAAASGDHHAGVAGGAATAAGGDAAAAPDDHGEEAWRKRMAQARDNVSRDQVLLDALQMRVNGLLMDYDRHDPFERANIGEVRKKALDELERVKANLELSKKQIANIEEDARKAGVPPGWVR
jgi:hypothetical protein